jgi:hypothetical protein
MRWHHAPMRPRLPHGLEPATSTDHAAWVVGAMTGRDGVALVIPGGFDRYARLLHPLPDGTVWPAAYRATGTDRYPYPYATPDDQPLLAVEGHMGPALADALTPVLAAASGTPARCHYGVWRGWGEINGSRVTISFSSYGTSGSDGIGTSVVDDDEAVHAFVAACPVQPWWGGRDVLLMDGPLDAVPSSVGPQWWWPEDRCWFVANEIDHPWSYVGGDAALIAALLGTPGVDGVAIDHADRW